VAVLLLAGLAFVAPGNRPGLSPAPSSALAGWTRSALPVLAELIGDCTAIESHSGPTVAPAAGSQRDNAARYGADLAAALRLPAPPDSGLEQAWRALLGELTSAGRDLKTVRVEDQKAIARIHLRFAGVGTELLEFQQAIRPAQ
jgi:hypothetical protein